MTSDHIKRIRSSVRPDDMHLQESPLDKLLRSGLSEFFGRIGKGIAISTQLLLRIHHLFCVVDKLEKIALAVWKDATKRSIQNVSETSASIKDAD